LRDSSSFIGVTSAGITPLIKLLSNICLLVQARLTMLEPMIGFGLCLVNDRPNSASIPELRLDTGFIPAYVF
ncbi:TPA: hypothetical protein DCE37_25160, partial [Candidatus Latescibacteria bacterium]|nr:hypothetical protein [Candidatus Latescibacterota bacterium]